MNELSMLKNLSVVDETVSFRDALIESVRVVFADITRYPLEIIDPAADLEADLGIDSVKLGEIFAVLRERYRLPAREVLMDLSPERFRTVAGIADLIAELRDQAPPSATETLIAPVPTLEIEIPVDAARPAVTIAPPVANTTLLLEVTQIFADITRYPVEILEADADFENDLGIDSVKLGEVFAVLREKYHLPPAEALRELWSPETMRTIRGIVVGIEALRGPAAPMPAPVPATLKPVVAPAVRPTTAPRKFEGKIALITGSGRGLGRDLALYLGELGATVLVNSFHSRAAGEATAEEIRRAGGTAHHLWASVANVQQLDAMFDTIEQRFGGLDFLVANASNGLLASMDKIQPEHWEKALRTNVIGLQQCAMRAWPLMKARGGGRIVTMSSVAAHRYVDYFSCMGPIKAAVEALTKYLAIQLQPDNIRVNCLSATAVYGDLVDKWPDRDRLVPLWEAGAGGRLCTAADIAHALDYLLSDGSIMMNGHVLVLDGGQAVRR